MNTHTMPITIASDWPTDEMNGVLHSRQSRSVSKQTVIKADLYFSMPRARLWQGRRMKKRVRGVVHLH